MRRLQIRISTPPSSKTWCSRLSTRRVRGTIARSRSICRAWHPSSDRSRTGCFLVASISILGSRPSGRTHNILEASMSRILRKTTVFALRSFGLFATLFHSTASLAQGASRPLQLSFGANALAYERTKTSIDGDSATATSTDLGPEASGFTIGFGIRPAESWLIGLTLHGSRSRVTDGRDGTPALTRSAYAMMPRLEYWFAPGESVSPYAGAALGLRGSSASAGPDAKASTSDFVIGGLAGVRVFPASSFSIDPNLALLAVTGGGEANGVKLDRGGFAFIIGVSL